MWPFKRQSRDPEPETVEEVIVDKIYGKGKNSHHIVVGIVGTVGVAVSWRAYFNLDEYRLPGVKVIPRSGLMNKVRAKKVAYFWARALEATYDMSLEQQVEAL